jgi:hypothetical protein
MKKLIITILATLLILSLVGCAGTNETADPEVGISNPDASADTSTSDIDNDGVNDAEQNKETAQSYDNVHGTNVSMYPNAQLVYSSKDEIVYAATDSGEAVNDFYKNQPNLKKGPGSGSVQEGYYYYSTPLTDLLRDMGTDPDKYQEKIDEINAYINESGGLQMLEIYDVNVDAQYIEEKFGSILSELPVDKTLIRYALIEEM